MMKNSRLSSLWSDWLGRGASRRLQQRILPNHRWNQQVWGETVLGILAPPLRWLDAGCGWRLLGKDLEVLERRLVNQARLTVGADIDFAQLRKHNLISRRTCASLQALPFRDASFDLVTCNMVLEHLSEPELVFSELSRVLAPGGRIMVHTPNVYNYLVFINLIAKKLLPRSVVLRLIGDGRAPEDIYPTFYRANSRRALRQLGARVNLEPEFMRLLTQPQPYTRFFAPLALFELLLMRATLTPPLDRFGATIIMCFRKPVSAAAEVEQDLPPLENLRACLR